MARHRADPEPPPPYLDYTPWQSRPPVGLIELCQKAKTLPVFAQSTQPGVDSVHPLGNGQALPGFLLRPAASFACCGLQGGNANAGMPPPKVHPQKFSVGQLTMESPSSRSQHSTRPRVVVVVVVDPLYGSVLPIFNLEFLQLIGYRLQLGPFQQAHGGWDFGVRPLASVKIVKSRMCQRQCQSSVSAAAKPGTALPVRLPKERHDSTTGRKKQTAAHEDEALATTTTLRRTGRLMASRPIC
ncbi:hypothetical protein CSOJ01_14185 [Colletotrichum sojae]|uniref:Uncharacterized protein n=1 Tax=Colletotrichum sojae TaxID=2175907 RepID=A0A8H6IQG2_9PEZI|nr:hypothetical protein CSOJ01_14185 [Colletotrichum sojae]